MSYPEFQKIMHAACDQVQCVIPDVMIQEEEKKVMEGQETRKTILTQRQSDRQHLTVKKPKKFKKLTLAQLAQFQFNELQQKYAQLCTIIETRE